MLKCENCTYKNFKNDLTCCLVNQLGEAITQLKKSIPVIGKYVKDYECGWYQKEEAPEDENKY